MNKPSYNIGKTLEEAFDDLFGELRMKPIEIANLNEIIKLQYPHVCMYFSEAVAFTNIPANNKNFYPCKYREARNAGKLGFMNGGQTMIWTDWRIDPGMIKIGFHTPTDTIKGWSEPMSFKEADDVMKIYKMMKLKAFW